MAVLSSVAVSAARVIVSAMCVAVSAPGGVIVHDVVSLWGWTYTRIQMFWLKEY